MEQLCVEYEMGKDLLLKRINDAKEGLPETLLAYIDREINDTNVKAPVGYFGKKLSELIAEDITYISSLKKTNNINPFQT